MPSDRRRFLPPDQWSADYLLRRPLERDRPGLARLATALWDPSLAGQFEHRWWWHDDEPHCWIAEHRPTGAVAAICAQRRVRYLVAGRPEPASTVSDWYVAPDHAGSGLGQALVRRGEATAAFMYTSAISDQAARGFTRLGWIGDRRIPMSAGPVPLVAYRAGRPGPGLRIEHRTVSAHDAGDLTPIDAVWEHLAWTSPAMMVRDAEYLRGHLTLAGSRRYSLFIAWRRERAVGYLLCRTLPPGALRFFGPARVGIVSDYLVDEDDMAALRDLVGAAGRWWSTQRVRVLLALTASETHRAVLTRLGMLGPVTVGGRMLGRRMSSRSMYRPHPGLGDHWHLTFADNDTDLILGAPPTGDGDPAP